MIEVTNPATGQTVGRVCKCTADDAREAFARAREVADAEVLHRRRSQTGRADSSHAEGENQQHQQTDERDQVRELLCDEVSAALIGVQRPHRRDTGAQVVHPPQTRPQRSQQTDTGDSTTLIDRRFHDLVDHLTGVALHRIRDLLLQLIHQIRARRQDETDACEKEHDQREDRQHREVGDAGGELVATFRPEALVHAHQVCDRWRFLLHFRHRPAALLGRVGALNPLLIREALAGRRSRCHG